MVNQSGLMPVDFYFFILMLCTNLKNFKCIGAFGGPHCGTVGRCVWDSSLVGVDDSGMDIKTDIHNV